MGDILSGFDLDNPELPRAISKVALESGNFPYTEKLDEEEFAEQLYDLQVQLVHLQSHLLESGERVVMLFEGRDAAGKGGTIQAYTDNLNPRMNIVAALPKPSDREATQWYFQRYVDWMPAATETVLFDRSWYNRAGVEPVMGFCTPEQTEKFLKQAPKFEKMLTDDGIHLFKFYLDIGREMQVKRFHDRRHDPLKTWKLSSIDYKALGLWDAYSKARDTMLSETDTDYAPWTVVLANDKRRARLSVIRTVLKTLNFSGKSDKACGEVDHKVVMGAKDFLKRERD